MAGVHIEARIIDGLVSWFGGVNLPAGVRVAYPNVEFVPNGKPYVRLSIEKNQPQTVHIGGGVEPLRMGFLMAVVCWPIGRGLVEPTELAGAIRDRFAFATVIPADGFEIRIVEEPRVAGDQQGPVYTEIPVVIPWHVYP